MIRKCKYALYLLLVASVFTLIVCSTDSTPTNIYAHSVENESDMDQPYNDEKILEPVHKQSQQNYNITIIIGSIMYQDYRQDQYLYCYCKYHSTTLEIPSRSTEGTMIMSYRD